MPRESTAVMGVGIRRHLRVDRYGLGVSRPHHGPREPKDSGVAMSLSLHRTLCIEALTRAITEHDAPRYHHSDRGVQYCSYDYIDILKKHDITPSMAAVGMSVDNPYAESLNRSIKVEEVYPHAYESFAEAKASIAKYIEV